MEKDFSLQCKFRLQLKCYIHVYYNTYTLAMIIMKKTTVYVAHEIN